MIFFTFARQSINATSKPFKYIYKPEVIDVVVILASDVIVNKEYVRTSPNEKTNIIKNNLYRLFSKEHLMSVLLMPPKKTNIIDKIRKDACREPLFDDTFAAPDGNNDSSLIGDRYSVGSKKLEPTHFETFFKNLASDHPKDMFTVDLAGRKFTLQAGMHNSNTPHPSPVE